MRKRICDSFDLNSLYNGIDVGSPFKTGMVRPSFGFILAPRGPGAARLVVRLACGLQAAEQ